MEDSTYLVRNLTIEDIPLMVKARVAQEVENGNGASKEYQSWYVKSLERLFNDNRIIAVGLFVEQELVSLGCFNLINFGSAKKIPYLCAVWTDVRYRGHGFSTLVNSRLFENLKLIKEDLQVFSLLTLEGTEAAYNLYRKLDYINVDGEMTFLGDVIKSDKLYDETETFNKSDLRRTIIYTFNGKEILSITFSVEQFLAHPLNLNGKTVRILQIKPLGDLAIDDLKSCLQNFFSKYRFCKFNVNELLNFGFGNFFDSKLKNKEDISQYLLNLSFADQNGKTIGIKTANNVMRKDLSDILK